MRRRLIVTYVGLLAAVIIGLSIPLALVFATGNAKTMFIDRLDDAAHFASIAEPALLDRETSVLRGELELYERLYGIGALIVDREGERVLASSESTLRSTAVDENTINAALQGRQVGLDSTRWPWNNDPVVVAAPVAGQGGIIGAAVTISPSGGLNRSTMQGWGLLAGLGVVVLGLGVAASVPLSRWMLRPVHELDEAAQALARGRFSGAMTVQSGPPELRRLADTFTTMARNITALLDRQRTFASYASHQLRTPLATLRLVLENLAPSIRDEGAEDYALLADEVDRMASMCDALLSYALAEVVEGEDLRVQDAAAIADSRVAAWRPTADQAGVRLERWGEEAAPVRAADQVLDQILDALLSNAVKFAGAGATVVIAVIANGPKWVEVHVVDNGPGLPVEHLAQAAEPFWRAPAHQNVEGSGLGITIAGALVKASGGLLELTPATPHGLHARLRLPRASTEAIP